MAEAVTSTVVQKVIDLLFSAVKREINYVRNCTEKMNELKNEVKNLTNLRDGIQLRINEARVKGEIPAPGVEEWVAAAGAQINKAEKIINDEADAKKTCCNLRLCVNLGTLYRYGKVASITTPFLQEHHKNGRINYDTRVSIPTSTPSFVNLYQKKNLDDIVTQKLTLEKIVAAVSDHSKQIVGIYGLGGVGKSTLAKEAAAKVNTLFSETVMITVSQTVDVEKIKKTVENAAKRIINGEMVLIVLDDVWQKVDLADLGIPCGNDHTNCKILITSRSKNVCEEMAEQSNNIICVNTLTPEESWILFKRAVGERLDTDAKLKRIAEKVTEECGGLPLILQALGKALKQKPIKIWEAALDRLQNHAPMEIDQEIRKAFKQLKLSYELLESEEAKSCFLLCSLFKEDEIIQLKVLAEYGVGLGFFRNLDSISDARNRVQLAVETLKSAFLLLNGKEESEVRMHDVVRDVALLIVKDEFMVKAGKGLTEWDPRFNASETYKRISFMDNKIRKLPDYKLHFPKVDTFLIQHSEVSVIPDEFFEHMREVKVLDLSRNNISSLPQSLKLLTKLTTLDLSHNMSLHEISILGELKDLEILNLQWTGIKTIPEEICKLTKLRLLDLDDCRQLSLTPGIISKLTSLEELYIDVRGFYVNSDQFDLKELRNLKWLKSLHLYVSKAHPFPIGNNFEKLTEFFIHVNGKLLDRSHPQTSHIKRRLQMTGCDVAYMKQCKQMIQASGAIILQWIKDMENIVPDLYQDIDSFGELKCVTLQNCHNVVCLVKTIGVIGTTTNEKYFSQVEQIKLEALSRLEVLWDCPNQYVSFRNLKRMRIERCSSLTKLFPVSVARGLTNLRDIWIWKCDGLVAVITDDKEQTSGSEIEQTDEKIVFPCLTNIWFNSLAKLESFYSGHSTMIYPCLEYIGVEKCPSMEKWGDGIHEIPQINFHHEGNSCSINDVIALHHQTKERIAFGTSSWHTV